jgi:AcrR family transcriptional regulator
VSERGARRGTKVPESNRESVRRAREQQILDEAAALFSRRGFHNTSLQELGDLLGLTRPAFYYYFKTKEDLLWRLIGELGDGLLEHARPIAKLKVSPQERFRRLIKLHVVTLLRNADAFRISFAERHMISPERDAEFKVGEQAYQELLEGVVSEGQARGVFDNSTPAKLLVLYATGTANSLVRWYHDFEKLSADEVAESVADYIIRGVTSKRRDDARTNDNGTRKKTRNGGTGADQHAR